MSYHRRTFRFIKLEKSGDFASRKNVMEDKVLDNKIKVLEKEEKCIRQKLFEIRREKYSRNFYKNPERASSSKFVDINVSENNETNQEKNKCNLLTASGVERTKSSFRRQSCSVEEHNPGQVVRVCVSSKFEDKVTGDESPFSGGAFSSIDKSKKRNRRHSVAVVTDIDRRKVLDLFKSEQTRYQSISSGVSFAEQASKDDLYFGCKYQENCSDSMFLFDISLDRDRDGCSTLVSDLTSQRNLSQVNFSGDVTCCDKQEQKSHFAKQVVSAKNPSILKADADRKDIRQSVKVISPRRRTMSQPTRPQSSRTYSDSCVEEKPTYRKCSTPGPIMSKKHSRIAFVEPDVATIALHKLAKLTPNMPRNRAMGLKRRPRSLPEMPSQSHQGSVLTEKEEKMAEQVLIRQIEIQASAEKMKRLSLQHFGESKPRPKFRKQSVTVSSSSSPHFRRGTETLIANDFYNNNETQRPGIIRRQTDNPETLRKFVKNQCKKEKGQHTMEQILLGLSGDMPDCRYLRCDQVQ